MTTIPVQLPDDLQAFVEANVQRGQFASANDYIVALVDAARRKRSEIEAALVEGLESGPAEEWTEQDWTEMKQRVEKKSASLNARRAVPVFGRRSSATISAATTSNPTTSLPKNGTDGELAKR